MMKKNSEPNWLVLIALVAPVLGLFWLEAGMPLSRAGHIVMETGLVFLLYGLVETWVHIN